MSTDLHDRTTNPSPEPHEPEKRKPALSLAQVAGGALAAMTAAALGSRLSVAGTVVGAALASVVAAVAGAVYTSSLRRTHDRVSAVWRTRSRSAGTPAASAAPAAPAAVTSGVGATRVDAPAGAAPASPTDGPTQAGGRRRIGWKPVLAGALLMFAIAAVALTGLELATGRALSGGSGTTVGQVAEHRTAPSSKPTEVRPTSEPTATPTSSASGQATASPSSTPSSEPTAAPTPSATATPSASAVPTPTATSSGSAPIPSSATTP